MMIFAMRNPSLRINERQGFVIVSKFVSAADLASIVIQCPAGNFAKQGLRLRAVEGWLAFALTAGFVGQRTHVCS